MTRILWYPGFGVVVFVVLPCFDSTHALLMDAGVLDCVLELMCEDFKHFEEHAADRSDKEATAGRVSCPGSQAGPLSLFASLAGALVSKHGFLPLPLPLSGRTGLKLWALALGRVCALIAHFAGPHPCPPTIPPLVSSRV